MELEVGSAAIGKQAGVVSVTCFGPAISRGLAPSDYSPGWAGLFSREDRLGLKHLSGSELQWMEPRHARLFFSRVYREILTIRKDWWQSAEVGNCRFGEQSIIPEPEPKVP
jgi:hypothetical protein